MSPRAQALLQDRSMVWLLPLVVAALFLLSRPAPIDVPQITALQAKQLIDAGALVLDVRSAEAYGKQHLPEAISVPLDSLSREIPPALAQNSGRPIVVYCNDGARTGPKGTKLLRDAGFARAFNLDAGIEGWSQAGYPVRR
ncbi:MAG TPA: rhodanese-like domain-containing protein [Burkholderiales bacterium]|nr:rhodanese-like domain-containing protein [Burkholderiales bacterium]